jgi:DNA-binding beta-propeller fold protein YncE
VIENIRRFNVGVFFLALAAMACQSRTVVKEEIVPETTLSAILELGGQYGEPDHVFSHPWDVEVDEEDNLYVLDGDNHRIMVYSSDGEFLRQIGSAGSGPGEFYGCRDFCLGGDGKIYVAEAGNSRVQVLTGEGEYLTEFPLQHEITALEMGPNGNLYINADATESNNLVDVFSPAGELLFSILDIIPDQKNRVNVTQALNRIRLDFDRQGNILLGRYSLALFEKYDDQLNRVFRVHLCGPEVDSARTFLYHTYSRFFKKRKWQGKDALKDFIEDVAIASSDGRSHNAIYINEIEDGPDGYYLLVGGVVLVYGQDGRLVGKLRLRDKNGEPAWIHNMCIDSQEFIYGIDRFHTFKCYKFKTPDQASM